MEIKNTPQSLQKQPLNDALTDADNNNALLKTLVRFDRNIAKNGISFTKFEKDGDLMFDLVVYFANSYQDNFFGFGRLDVDDFCKKMHYKKSNLFKTHPSPRQFLRPGIKKEFNKLKAKSENIPNGKASVNKDDFFYTVLDNALFRLSDEGVDFRFKVKTDDVNNSASSSIMIIKVINKQYKDVTNSKNSDLKKIVYYYTLHDDFINNLTKWFLNINLFSVSKLRKSNSVYLYSYLKNLQLDLVAMDKTFTDSVNFDLLLELGQISIASPRLAKQKLISKLETIFTLTDLKGKVDFIKRKKNGKETGHAYQPVITFYNNIPKLYSKEYSAQVLEAVTVRFLHDSKKLYTSLGGMKLNLTYSDWLLSCINSPIGDPSYTTIRSTAKNAYELVTSESMSIGDTRITNLLKNGVLVVSSMKKTNTLKAPKD